MYKKLSKEEKKKVRKAYSLTNKGSEMMILFNRLIIEGIVSLVMAIIILSFIIFNDYSKWLFGLVAILVICGLLFILAQRAIRIKEYNRFIKNGYEKVKNKLTKKK